MIAELQDLAEKYVPDIMPRLQKVVSLQKAQEPFNKRALGLIWEAEKTIPGAGIHYSIIKEGRYSYPADYKFQNVVRPLRYSLNELSYTYAEVSSARYSIEASGGHLEGCMKVLLGWLRNRKPLGALIKSNKAGQLLEKELVEDMTQFVNLAINPAKHEFTSRNGLDPVFQFADALHAHFLARHFGATILQEAGILDYIEALKPLPGQKVQVFPGARLPVSYEDR